MKMNKVVSEIEEIAQEIKKFNKINNRYPKSLEEVFDYLLLDPWGNVYQYLKLEMISNKDKHKIRKNKNEKNINSKFDLYSMGPDGKSAAPLTANSSKDDIIYANDGYFIGEVVDYRY